MHGRKQGMHGQVRAFFSVGALCILALGCRSPIHRDNSGLVITPGLGISNVLELSMTPQEIAHKTGDLIVKELKTVGAWSFEVPSLGASWEQESKDQPPPGVYFHVAPGTQLSHCFRGKVRGGLSFGGEVAVTREDVVRVFGPPRHVLREAIVLSKNADELREWATRGEPYALQNPVTGTETVIYPTQGIHFGLHSNAVVVVNVFRAARK
ncbi:MAG: hypothetical protein HYV35_09655 [Lentisphaerae bacterium]|nr:hypothetical protein [Lentisphaerota bacterium]